MNIKKRLSIIISGILLLIFPFSKESHAMSVSAHGAILMEQQSGRVLYEKNAHEIRRIASITKIMTAILAIESGKLEDVVKVSRTAAFEEGSSIYLMPNEKILLKDLVYGLMLRSGNDAANAIAEHVGGSIEGFVFLMNKKAEEIGMTNTNFLNPSGLDTHENHYSTPYDMALLTRYAMNNNVYKEISGTKIYTFQREEGRQSWKNKNRLLTEKYKYCTGGKTGFTKRAGRTLVTTASKDGKDLIAVTLNAGDDWNDHISMYEYGFDQFQLKTVLSKGPISDKSLPIDGEKELYIDESVVYPLAEDEKANIRIKFKLVAPKQLKNMESGIAGRATVYFNDDPVRKVPIYIKDLTHDDKKSWWQIFRNLFASQIGVINND